MPGSRLRIVFAGTPDFAVPALQACVAAHDVVAVYTQPDRPAGRGRKLAPSPVKKAALQAGLSVEQPTSLRAADVRRRLRDYAPDLMVVTAYGLILPRAVLATPRLGCWNVHASLLPRWRGAAPIQRAILAGDRMTGVCLMQMEHGLDTGPVLLREATEIHSDDTGGSLHDRLAALGAQVLAEGLRRAADSHMPAAEPQPAEGASYAHKLSKSEARLDFSRAAIDVERQVRAFNPWPVADAELTGERVRIWRAVALAATPGLPPAAPGTVISASKRGIDIVCGDGVLRILELQRPGGRRISAADYSNARGGLHKT